MVENFQKNCFQTEYAIWSESTVVAIINILPLNEGAMEIIKRGDKFSARGGVNFSRLAKFSLVGN